MTLARATTHVSQEHGGGSFVWPDATTSTSWDKARYPATSEDVRDLGDIALPELTAILRGCTSDDPITEAARALGVKRLSAAGRERLRQATPTRGHIA